MTAPVKSIPAMRKSPLGISDRSVKAVRLRSRMTRPSHRITHSASSRGVAACAKTDAREKARIVRNINTPRGPQPEKSAPDAVRFVNCLVYHRAAGSGNSERFGFVGKGVEVALCCPD